MTSATAGPGNASTTTSAPASASATASTGAPPGPLAPALRPPYTTSCPAPCHRWPSAPPTFPVPITAMRMPVPP